MIHANHEPGSNCPGHLLGRGFIGGRRVLGLWECDACGAVNDPRIRRRLAWIWRRLLETGRIDEPGVSPMKGKLVLCVNRKIGAPDYSSDGASASIELEIEAATDGELQAKSATTAAAWQPLLNAMVEADLKRQASLHESTKPTEPAAGRMSAPPPAGHADGYEDDVDRFDECSDPPPPRRTPPPERRNGNGYGGRDHQRNGRAPRTGRELLSVCRDDDRMDAQLKRIARDLNRGKIVDFDEELVAWVWAELNGGNGRNRERRGSWAEGRN